MNNKQSQRLPTRTLTEEEKNRLEKARAQVAEELPDLIRRNKKAHEVMHEPTVSGDLRRAVHHRQEDLFSLGEKVRIDPIALDKFLAGEDTLPSDSLDRLAKELGFHLVPATGGGASHAS